MLKGSSGRRSRVTSTLKLSRGGGGAPALKRCRPRVEGVSAHELVKIKNSDCLLLKNFAVRLFFGARCITDTVLVNPNSIKTYFRSSLISSAFPTLADCFVYERRYCMVLGPCGLGMGFFVV